MEFCSRSAEKHEILSVRLNVCDTVRLGGRGHFSGLRQFTIEMSLLFVLQFQ